MTWRLEETVATSAGHVSAGVAGDGPWLGPEVQDAVYAQFALADERCTAEAEPQVRSIRCPVGALWSEDARWIPANRGAALADLVGVRLERLKGLGHLPQLEARNRVADRLLHAFAEHVHV